MSQHLTLADLQAAAARLHACGVQACPTVAEYFGDRLDGVLDAPPSGQASPTTIRDALSGAIIRA